MICIKDAFKFSPRKFCIRSKHGTWVTSSRDEVEAAIGHTDCADLIFTKYTDNEDLRILLNGRRAYLDPEDFS